ncbi:translesion error-prone DNA polymerase V autoproteolytic subunit [bacterium]|nr:translesion error-prone DNA polymerase V autoproteolytic subunit [bacterium]MCP5462059.1 translesion error-prone DNA polymerase V autoproteolytic subunit [bacterium]
MLRVKEIYSTECRSSVEIPLATGKIAAGFPSPADDFAERSLDLNTYLIKHPSATFFVRVEGDSMINAGIHSGDILIVDKALEPQDKKIVVAVVQGDFTVKRICKINGDFYLMPENQLFKPIKVTEEMAVEIWGVVTYVIHKPQ